MEKLRKKLVLFSAMLGLLLTSAIPAVAQAPEGEGTCVFFSEEGGYLCLFSPFQESTLRCPAEEPAEEGDTLNCRSIETGERFTCTVVEEVIEGIEGSVIRISCVPAEEEERPPLPEPSPPAAPPPEPPPAAPLEITQELEQEAESGEIDQSFEVS